MNDSTDNRNETPADKTPTSDNREAFTESTALELLKTKLEHQQRLQGDFFKATSMFLIISGALLKFALDTDANDMLRTALIIMGIAIPSVGLLVVYDGKRATRQSDAEIEHLNNLLGSPLSNTSGYPLHYCIKAIFLLCVVAIIGFLVLLIVLQIRGT